MGIKQFFNKSSRDVKNAFSKNSMYGSLRKMGNSLAQVRPYLSNTGDILNGVGSVVALGAPPVGVAMKALGSGMNGLGVASSVAGNFARNQYNAHQRSIQANKPKPPVNNHQIYY